MTSKPPLKSETQTAISGLDLLVFGFIAALGSFWAFTRGGQDFNVFYTAAQHVRAGHPELLYTVSPDRFLYAPGFSWFLVPLAVFSLPVALGIWTLLKTLVAGFAVYQWRNELAARTTLTRAKQVTAIALLITARFWLIDFQYGQINLFLFSIASLALLELKNHSAPTGKAFVYWTLLGALTIIKPLTAPVLFVLLFCSTKNLRLLPLLWAPAVGAVVTLGIPSLTTETSNYTLYTSWLEAIRNKGLPLYTHNQSFIAFLHRWFGDAPSRPVFSPEPTDYSLHLLGQTSITVLGWIWGLIFFGLLARECARPIHQLKVGRILALIPLPHYLVWKPYLIFAFPVVALSTDAVLKKQSPPAWILFLIPTLIFLLSGFDVVGVKAATVLESLSLFLWATLIFILRSSD